MDIKEAVEALSKERKIFHSEADFQLALFRKIIDRYTKRKCVRFEYALGRNECNLKHLKEIPHFDIMITNEEYEPTVAIELKYAAKNIECIERGEGRDEYFSLPSRGGQCCERYGFWNDIKRLQAFVTNKKISRAGYVIFLTNDNLYWEDSNGTVDRDFKIHQGRQTYKGQRLEWRGKNERSYIDVEYKYPSLNWMDYSELDKNMANKSFRYLLLKIPSE